MFETLEPRQLLSATASATFSHGILTVTGTEAADNVEFESDPAFITAHLNGAAHRFDAPKVTSIQINTQAGDDRVILGRKLPLGVTIDSGAGNDTLSAGCGDDILFAGDGDDLIWGGDGNDYVDAGAGNDVIDDYYGRNVLHGGAGDDTGMVDAWLLGSGIESRQMVIIYNPKVPPAPSDIYDVSKLGYSGTSLSWQDNHLILEYSGYVGSGSDNVEFSDVRVDSDGRLEVQLIVTSPDLGTADVKYFSHQWDVTGAVEHGLVFTQRHVQLNDQGQIAKSDHIRSPLLLQPSPA